MVEVHIAGTVPYAWPFDGRLEGPTLALLLAGWDELWWKRSIEPESARAAGEELGHAVRLVGGMVIAVAHRGAAVLPIAPGTHGVTADGLDAFHGGPLDGALRRGGRTHLLVAGLGLEGPVHSTLRSANDRGFECLLVTDATAALTTSLVEASAKTITMSGGIFGAIGSTAATLDALQAIPRGPSRERELT